MATKMIPEGERFGRLKVTGSRELRKSGNKKLLYHECICDCGKVVWVRGSNLRNGSIVSCGCYGKEQRKQSVYKHGESKSRLYRIWNNMRTRCNKPYSDSYKNYGERGISVCKEWDNTNDGFQNFYKWSMSNGYSDKLTIDRIDVNGNYEPSNCRWTTQYTQCRNKRTNHYLMVNGERKIITDVATENGLKTNTLQGRLDRGYSVEMALLKEMPKKRLILYDGELLTPKQFSEVTGVNFNTVMTRMTKGYTNAEDLILQNRNILYQKPVDQYDLQGNYVDSFPSASEAARQNKCCKSGVIDCCNGKKNKFKGFIYKYHES